MTTSELQWLVGIAVSAALGLAGMVIAAFRTLSGRIEDTNTALSKNIRDGDDQLHERVNRVRDEYVRRVDLDGHMGRIDTTLRELRDEQREIGKALIAVLPLLRGRADL